MRQKKYTSLLVLAAILAAALVACGKSDSSTTGPSDPGGFLGTYVLTSLDGSRPPGVYYITGSQTLVLDTAVIRVNAATYSDLRTTTLTDAHGVTVATNTRTGAYTTSGTQITMQYTNDLGIPSTITMTLAGRTLTSVEGPPDQRRTLIFTK